MKLILPSEITDAGAFTRASTATYFDSDGVMRTAPVNTPRFSYDQFDLSAGPRFLKEDAATNIALRSETFASPWETDGTTSITTNSVVAPNGTTTGARITKTTAGGYLYQGLSGITPGETYTYMLYMKAGTGGSQVRMNMYHYPNPSKGITVNMTTGVGTPDSGVVGNAAMRDDGWILAWMEASTAPGETTFLMDIILSNSAIGEYHYFWGADVKMGERSSYIPTTSAPVTRAADVNTAVLVSNVVETAPAIYNGGTTYAAGETASVSVGPGLMLDVYTSLQAGNTGNTPASSPAHWKKTGSAVYAAYNAGTAYALNDRSQDSHLIYQSAQAANTGHALTDTAWWTDAGATNRWAMFDESTSSETTNPDTISVVMRPGGIVTGLAMMGLEGTSVDVTFRESSGAFVSYQRIELVETSGVYDFWTWLFSPIVQKTEFSITDFPPIYDPIVEITVNHVGSIAKASTLVIGQALEIGDTQYGASVGIRDYSIKTQDAFGRYQITRRGFSRKANFTVFVAAGNVDSLFNTLADLRATPAVYIGSEIYGSTLTYGFYKDFAIVIEYWNYSVLNIEIEGLS